jgi:hypothetical protein
MRCGLGVKLSVGLSALQKKFAPEKRALAVQPYSQFWFYLNLGNSNEVLRQQ